MDIQRKEKLLQLFRTSFIPFLDDDCSSKSTPTSFYFVFWVCYDSLFFSPVATTDSMQFINLFSLRLPLCCSWVHLKLAGFMQQFQSSYRRKQLWISRLDKSVAYLWKIWNLTFTFLRNNQLRNRFACCIFLHLEICFQIFSVEGSRQVLQSEFLVKASFNMQNVITSV